MFAGLFRIGDLPPRAQAQPAQNRAHVTLDRVLADLQRDGYLAVAGAKPDQLRDLLLAAGEGRAGGAAARPPIRCGFLCNEQQHRFVRPPAQAHCAERAGGIARAVDPARAFARSKAQVRARQEMVRFQIRTIRREYCGQGFRPKPGVVEIAVSRSHREELGRIYGALRLQERAAQRKRELFRRASLRLGPREQLRGTVEIAGIQGQPRGRGDRAQQPV
jgi:hypothetical protein